MSSIDKLLAWLYGREHFGVKLGLSNIKRLLAALGHPEKKYTIVHVAGTNGKGTISTALAHILKHGGYKTGLFTSPHIVDIRERFLIDGKFANENILAQAIDAIKQSAEDAKIDATFFECATAVAAKAFAIAKVDVAIFEVGMGGRLDATTALNNRKLGIISRIGFDHMKHLGNTLSEIASEKAAIMQKDMPVIVAPQEEEAAKAIKIHAESVGAHPKFPNINIENDEVHIYDDKTELILDLDSQTPKHQKMNLAIAAFAAYVGNDLGLWNISESIITEAAKSVRIPLRLQMIENYEPLLLLDVAHNIDGFRAQSEYLKLLNDKLPPRNKRVALIGLLEDKQIDEIMKLLATYVSEIVITRPQTPRAARMETLIEAVPKNIPAHKVPLPVEAFVYAKSLAGKDGMVIATGSFYMLSAIVEWLEKEGTNIRNEWFN